MTEKAFHFAARGGPVAEHITAELQVLGDRERSKDMSALGDERQAKSSDLLGALAENALAVETDGAGDRRDAASNRGKSGRLPRAVRSDDADHLAFAHCERSVAERN